MRHFIAGSLVGILLFAAPAVAAPMTNADVLQLTAGGLGDAVVIAAIRSAECGFDTSPKALLDMKAAGVSEAVLEAVVSCGVAPPGAAAVAPPDDPRAVGTAEVYYLPADGSPRVEMLTALLVGQNTDTARAVFSFGLARAKMKDVYEGERSAIRTVDPRPRFEVILKGNVDARRLTLQQLTVRDGVRQRLSGEMRMATGSGKTRTDAIPLELVEKPGRVHVATPSEDLVPGEYGLSFGAGTHTWDFGVDPVPGSVQPAPEPTEQPQAHTRSKGALGR